MDLAVDSAPTGSLIREPRGAIDPALFLRSLLVSLTDPSASQPSRNTAAAALVLCNVLMVHLRALVDPGGAEPSCSDDTATTPEAPCSSEFRDGAASLRADAIGEAAGQACAISRPAQPQALPLPAAVGVGSKASEGAPLADAEPHDAEPPLGPSRSRPSAKARRRVKRQQQEQHDQQQQQRQQEEHQQHDEAAVQFQQSLWNGAWQLAPMPPAMPPPPMLPPPLTEVELQQSLWNSGWQLVPLPTAAHLTPAIAEADFQQSMWNGGWLMVRPPPPQQPPLPPQPPPLPPPLPPQPLTAQPPLPPQHPPLLPPQQPPQQAQAHSPPPQPQPQPPPLPQPPQPQPQPAGVDSKVGGGGCDDGHEGEGSVSRGPDGSQAGLPQHAPTSKIATSES